MVESKNMAALDNGREKFDPIARKIVDTTDQQQAIQVKRLDIREIMGSHFFEAIVELTIWIADAHRGDGKRFVVCADEKLTAFVKLESGSSRLR